MSIPYERLSTILKRHRIEDKLCLSEKHSKILTQLNFYGNHQKIREYVYPWELESFVMLSIKSIEWKNDELSEHRFFEIINSIRNFSPPALLNPVNRTFVDWFLPNTAATQFDFQENFWYKVYRHFFYFSYQSESIDMNFEFRKKFGIDYLDILVAMLSMNMLYVVDPPRINELVESLIKKHPDIFNLFKINRETYINELDKHSSNPADYIYCLRPSYSYPFVEISGTTYLPLPHLLVRASTVSLMHRLTTDNIQLREKIGKEVLEPYLLSIVKDYPEFDYVLGEQTYDKGKQKGLRTPDVMATIKNDIICFDSKSFSPKSSLRTFSDETLDKEIERLAKDVVQVYHHIHDYYDNDYHFLPVRATADRSNIWGIVVVSENPHILMEALYTKAAKKLNLIVGSEEFEWLKGHVGLVSISSLEEQLFAGKDILTLIKKNATTKQYYDFWFAQKKLGVDCKRVASFKSKITDLVCKELLSLSGVSCSNLEKLCSEMYNTEQ